MLEAADLPLTAARLLASAINPLFVLLLLAAPYVVRSRSGGDAPRNRFEWGDVKWWMSCGTAVGVPVVLAEYGKREQVWAGHSAFPSGHETFAVACATCLIFRDRCWAPFAVSLAAVMAWALVRARYHDGSDVMGGLVLGTVSAAAVWLLIRVRRNGEQ